MNRSSHHRAWQVCLVMLLAWLAWPAFASDLKVETWLQDASGVSDVPIRVRAWLPPDYSATQARYPVLYVNDGQDMEAVRLGATLQKLYAEGAIQRMIVVAIDMPPDRMAGYGVFDRRTGEAIVASTRYGDVGANAHSYASWLTQVLVPAIDARYRTRAVADGRAILGWSLGALSAFGIGWQYPDVFGRVGAISPSFWLAADGRDAASVQASRLAHALVDGGGPGPRPQVFIAVGEAEETDDRDGDGVIDVVDDARDLVERMAARGTLVPGGGTQAERVVLYLLPGGRHDTSSWARMLPAFLQWVHGRRPANDQAR